MKNKAFDCVEMMHAGQAASEKRLEGMSRKQQLDYWLRRHRELLEKQARLRSREPVRAR